MARKALVVIATALLQGACAAPSTPDASQLARYWTGTYIIKQCSVTGWPSCDPSLGTSHAIRLDLNQNAANVSGMMTLDASSIPVTGTFTNGMLVLGGKATISNTKASAVSLAVTRWTASLNLQGELMGEFSYRDDTEWGIASAPNYPQNEIWTTAYEAEIVGTCPTTGPEVEHCR